MGRLAPTTTACCHPLFASITIPELLVLPQHQLRADLLHSKGAEGGRGRLYALKLALLTLP